MTDQKDTMPDEIWASSRPQDVGNRFTVSKCYDDQTRYIRADKSMVRDILKANQMQAEKIRELKQELDDLNTRKNAWIATAAENDAIAIRLKKERDLLARYVVNMHGYWRVNKTVKLARKIVEGKDE